MNQLEAIDLNIKWHLPAHYYTPDGDGVFHITVFTETQFEPLAKVIRESLPKRSSPPESVLVRWEAGVDADLIRQLYELFSELLPGVNVCFEGAFPKDLLYQHVFHLNKMRKVYKSLSN